MLARASRVVAHAADAARRMSSASSTSSRASPSPTAAPARADVRRRGASSSRVSRPSTGARARGSTRLSATWPKDVAGVKSWRGIKFDEFSFEVKKCPDGATAERLVREFCESDGLTDEFCQSALDLVFLAHNQRRPQDEIMMLQELATMLLRENRRRKSNPETFLAEELLQRFASADVAAAAAGDRDAAVRIAAVRAELRRVFLHGDRPRPASLGLFGDDDDAGTEPAPPVDRSGFLTHLERSKQRCKDDARRQRSIAQVGIDADERTVQEYIDPMEEIRMSGEALRETAARIEALQEMFREEIMS